MGAALGSSWIADFFCPTSCEGESFEQTAARVRATEAEQARDDLPERAAALLTYVWQETVRPYWERRRRVLEAAAGDHRRGRAAVHAGDAGATPVS